MAQVTSVTEALGKLIYASAGTELIFSCPEGRARVWKDDRGIVWSELERENKPGKPETHLEYDPTDDVCEDGPWRRNE